MARTFQNLRIYPNMSVLENVLVGCHRHERTGRSGGGLGLPRQRREERASRERAMATLGASTLRRWPHFLRRAFPMVPNVWSRSPEHLLPSRGCFFSMNPPRA